jgi:hypothetical protein
MRREILSLIVLSEGGAVCLWSVAITVSVGAGFSPHAAIPGNMDSKTNRVNALSFIVLLLVCTIVNRTIGFLHRLEVCRTRPLPNGKARPKTLLPGQTTGETPGSLRASTSRV